MSKLKIAIQKSGRLSEKSISLIQESGIHISNGARKLVSASSNYPLEVLYLRDDDIPRYVEDGVAHIGIVGENEYAEKACEVDLISAWAIPVAGSPLPFPKENPTRAWPTWRGNALPPPIR